MSRWPSLGDSGYRPCGTLIGPEGESCGVQEGECTEHGCKRCGRRKQPWQVFCGAACTAQWEAGSRPYFGEDQMKPLALTETRTWLQRWLDNDAPELRAEAFQAIGHITKAPESTDLEILALFLAGFLDRHTPKNSTTSVHILYLAQRIARTAQRGERYGELIDELCHVVGREAE